MGLMLAEGVLSHFYWRKKLIIFFYWYVLRCGDSGAIQWQIKILLHVINLLLQHPLLFWGGFTPDVGTQPQGRVSCLLERVQHWCWTMRLGLTFMLIPKVFWSGKGQSFLLFHDKLSKTVSARGICHVETENKEIWITWGYSTFSLQ